MTCFLNSPDARLLLEADRCTWVWARVSANLVFLSSGTVDTWTQRQWPPVSTRWWIYRTPVWQLSKLAGLLSQHRHHYKQQAPGGEIEQITTFTTAFDVIISSRIITVSPDRGTPQWANCKNRGLSYNPYKPPQGQPIHFDLYRHLITTVIDIFNAPKKLLDVETFNLDQVDYLRMALLKGIVSDLYAFQLSHFPEQLRTNREVDISF